MKTRYPILLVHGLAMKDTFFSKSFGGIDRILRMQGYEVYKSNVDAFGSVETNALQLREEVEAILRETRAQKVNIIAHSKGGLDAKYMIRRLGMADRVASLTTLCTPHGGSPVASGVLWLPGFILKILAFFIDLFYRLLGDASPDSLTACRELRRCDGPWREPPEECRAIFCQSFSSTMRRGDRRSGFMMIIPMAFARIAEKRGETDGMVPRDSAEFGLYRGDCLDASLCHTDIVDFMVPRRQKGRIYTFYSNLCGELAAQGL